ncbi:AAA family ATPase [Streptomyces hokutonensis]|uniref:AAA family ATPase n=1 Tax=Streptomyces hokutonensis TaxID=1306990 RepID=UPI003825E878
MTKASVERIANNSTARIIKVRAENFRGIAGDLDVSFEHASGKPSSALIFGDNGSGKSSIVDAVEWACQKTVGRSKALRGGATPSLANLAAGGARCSAEVKLSDGRSIKRWATFGEDGSKDGSNIFGDAVPPEFLRIPMSLKRADILRFLDTPDIKRGSIFIDHALGDEVPTTSSLTTDQQAVIDERHEAKRMMREAAARLAALVGVEHPPRDANEIAEMIAVDVYKRLPAVDRVKVTLPRAVQEQVEEVTKQKERVHQLNQTAKRLRLPTTATTERLLAMQTLLSGVGDWLTSAFLIVTGASHVKRIEPEFGRLSEVSLEIRVTLHGRTATTSPQKIFSEGYQDLIALLYFLAVARAAGEQGQAKILILDDVLQSVDANIRVALMELVVRDFKDWQLLITVHDRLWRNQLRDIFQRMGHPMVEIEIRQWRFDAGPNVVSGGVDPASSLWSAMDAADPFTVCGVAGRLLEQICDRLSWTIPTSVKRKRGDAYTLADLWPGIMKELKRTSCADTLMRVDRWVHLRNAAGAHYNEWAEGVTWVEAESFGYAVLEFYGEVHCDACKQWVERSGAKVFTCRCGVARIGSSN